MFTHLEPALVFALIGLMAMLCQWLAWRTNAPSIVFLLACGILAGPVLGIVNADDLLGELLFPIVSLAVAVILFEGSLTLRFDEIKDMTSTVWRMLSVGVLVTWAVIATAAHYLVGLALELAVLFGAIMVVTGPTVISPMLRSVRPTERIASLLRWEGIVIDPLGAVLAILVFDVILTQRTDALFTSALISVSKIVFVGMVSGCAVGYLLGLALRNYYLPDYLHNVSTLLVVVALFAITDSLVHESGLLAVTAMGIWLANMRDVHVDDILDFKESLSLLLISGLFILLASRLQLDTLAAIALPALGVVVVVQFVARPLKVLVSTWPGGLTWPERGLLAWIAPRGIVAAAIASLFALKLEEIAYPGAQLMVPLTFALIIGTVVWQGLTAPTVARWLGVARPEPNGVLFLGGNVVARALALKLSQAGFQVVIADSSWDNISQARMAGLPTFFGSAVSEHADRKLDLAGLGCLFAVSRRDDLNALACLRFTHAFGRDSVYSLTTRTGTPSSAKHTPAMAHRGRELFGIDVTYAQLAELLGRGAEIRQTTLSETFSYDDMRKEQPTVIPLAAWGASRQLHVNVDPENFQPAPQSTLMYLLPDDAKPDSLA